MGWTGIQVPGRPSTTELNRMLTSWIEDEDHRIIDRSGWQGYNSRIWLLVEPAQPEGPELPGTELLLVLVRYQDRMVLHKVVPESHGPLELDCPMRIIRKVGEHPPVNEYAANWRSRVIEHHEQTRGPKALKEAVDSSNNE